MMGCSLMASRETLPKIEGGDHILADALGVPFRPSEEPDREPHKQISSRQASGPGTLVNINSQAKSAACSPAKTKVPFNLPAELADEVRDAVFALSGPPHCLSLALLAENALRIELARLKEIENSGRRFPRRSGRIKPGRRVE